MPLRVQLRVPPAVLTFDLAFFALAIPAVMFAGISKGGFGSGAAFAATPLLALILDPRTALGLMLPLLMLMDAATLGPYWRQWETRDSIRLIAGALPGVGLGAWLYARADADTFRLLIGGISLAFVAFQLIRAGRRGARVERPLAAPWGWIAGIVAGFASFVSHAGGPPVAVYLLSRGVTKTTYQATTVLVFWVVNIAKVLPYALLGVFTSATLLAGLLLAPVALAGAWIGVRAHRLMPERAYFAVTYTLLTITGGKLIYDALA